MTFLVDANVLSEPTKPVPDIGVLQWLRRYERDKEVLSKGDSGGSAAGGDSHVSGLRDLGRRAASIHRGFHVIGQRDV